jgi:hypothetical protein
MLQKGCVPGGRLPTICDDGVNEGRILSRAPKMVNIDHPLFSQIYSIRKNVRQEYL